jgi:hypothetical protein
MRFTLSMEPSGYWRTTQPSWAIVIGLPVLSVASAANSDPCRTALSKSRVRSGAVLPARAAVAVFVFEAAIG